MLVFDVALPKLSEVAEVVRKASAASAPGPNGIPYKLYENWPGVLKHLWNLLRVAQTHKRQQILYFADKSLVRTVPLRLSPLSFNVFVRVSSSLCKNAKCLLSL